MVTENFIIEPTCDKYFRNILHKIDTNESSKIQEKFLEIDFQNEFSSSLGTFFVFVSFLLFHLTIFCPFRTPQGNLSNKRKRGHILELPKVLQQMRI